MRYTTCRKEYGWISITQKDVDRIQFAIKISESYNDLLIPNQPHHHRILRKDYIPIDTKGNFREA